ncbi:hypothetical protein SMICM304S_03452 [Streptomyces microflavus]
MASAQYETRTETVEKTVVVLTLTEGEADALRDIVGASDGTPDDGPHLRGAVKSDIARAAPLRRPRRSSTTA